MFNFRETASLYSAYLYSSYRACIYKSFVNEGRSAQCFVTFYTKNDCVYHLRDVSYTEQVTASYALLCVLICNKKKVKQAWTGPEGSRRLRLPDF
jgi:hypothetical protein